MPDYLSQFDRAGTVMDFVVSMMSDSSAVSMSPQNAASWGYFDPVSGEWNKAVLAAQDFPLGLLPAVTAVGTRVGALHHTWHDIQEKTPIVVALGDLQVCIACCCCCS